jgi:hypothetical protein
LFSIPAFCSDSFNYNYYDTSHAYYYTFDDFVSDGTVVKYRVDTSSNTSSTYFYIVSDQPITGTFTYKLDDTVKKTFDVNASTAAKLYKVTNSNGWSLSTSSDGIGGLYVVRLFCPSRDNLSYSDVNYYYTDVSSLTDSDFLSKIQSDFFLIAPGAEVGTEPTTGQVEEQTQTITEFLVGYLKLGVGLVISLMALLVVLSLLVKYLRRCLI